MTDSAHSGESLQALRARLVFAGDVPSVRALDQGTPTRRISRCRMPRLRQRSQGKQGCRRRQTTGAVDTITLPILFHGLDTRLCVRGWES
jgi:hypothetical protein